jgi:hypothetical protein
LNGNKVSSKKLPSQMKMLKLTVIRDNSARWNSVFSLIVRAFLLKDPLDLFIKRVIEKPANASPNRLSSLSHPRSRRTFRPQSILHGKALWRLFLENFPQLVRATPSGQFIFGCNNSVSETRHNDGDNPAIKADTDATIASLKTLRVKQESDQA